MKLSRKEKMLLDVLVEVDTASHAAVKLGLSESTVYNMLYRLRKKQERARRFINVLLGYRNRSPLIDKLLSRRVRVDEEKAE